MHSTRIPNLGLLLTEYTECALVLKFVKAFETNTGNSPLDENLLVDQPQAV